LRRSRREGTFDKAERGESRLQGVFLEKQNGIRHQMVGALKNDRGGGEVQEGPERVCLSLDFQDLAGGGGGDDLTRAEGWKKKVTGMQKRKGRGNWS